MNDLRLPIARKEGLVVQEMPDEILVYDLESNKAYCLNQTAALVWKFCNGKNSASDISKNLGRELKILVPEDLVWLAIDQLSKDNLLKEEIRLNIGGLSRREAVKKIGLASMIALPIVAMLSFPKAALAATCSASACSDTPDSGGCQAGTHCCRGNCYANTATCASVGQAC